MKWEGVVFSIVILAIIVLLVMIAMGWKALYSTESTRADSLAVELAECMAGSSGPPPVTAPHVGIVTEIDPNLLRPDAVKVEIMSVRSTIDDGSVEYEWTHWAVDQPSADTFYLSREAFERMKSDTMPKRLKFDDTPTGGPR